VRKPGNEGLLNYLGHKGWIVCLPTRSGTYLPDSVDEIPAITVEAKGQDWSHVWKVYGLIGEAVTKTECPEEASRLIKRKVVEEEGGQETSGTDSKRVKLENGLQVSDTFSDTSQDDANGADLVVVQEEEEECTGGMVPLFAKPDARPSRLDIFLTESFRERICRCKSVSKGCFTASGMRIVVIDTLPIL